jgi:conjugal transfer pilus assembly protein TraF
MVSKLIAVMLVVFATLSGTAAAVPDPGANSQIMQSWWDDSPWGDPERGFNWYPDPASQKPLEKKRSEKKDAPKSIYQMTNLDDVNKELKRIREVAIINPTEKHVHEYLQAQAWIMEKSSVFADTARRVVWSNPDVDYNNKSPVVTASRLNQNVRESSQRKSNVAELASEHGLLFFARSDCPYCHDQAPILKVFERNFGMSVLTVSMDGGPIPMFPDAKRDNGISMIVSGGAGIEMVPAVYLVNRRTNEAIPLGTGVLAAEDIAERIRVITRTKPGQEF